MQKIFSFSSFLLRFKEHVSSTPRMPYGEHRTTTFLLIDLHELIKLYNFRILQNSLLRSIGSNFPRLEKTTLLEEKKEYRFLKIVTENDFPKPPVINTLDYPFPQVNRYCEDQSTLAFPPRNAEFERIPLCSRHK